MILDGNKPQKLLKMQNFAVAKQVINSRSHQTASKENTGKFPRLVWLAVEFMDCLFVEHWIDDSQLWLI